MACVNVFFGKGVLPALGFWAGIIAVIITAMSDHAWWDSLERAADFCRFVHVAASWVQMSKILGLHSAPFHASSHPRAKKRNDALFRCIVLYIYTLICSCVLHFFKKKETIVLQRILARHKCHFGYQLSTPPHYSLAYQMY